MIITKEREGLYKAVQNGLPFYGWTHASALMEAMSNVSLIAKARDCRHIYYVNGKDRYKKCMLCMCVKKDSFTSV